jgi:5'-methylthioadenosine phosphorylase
VKVAFISGTSMVHSRLFSGWEPRNVATDFGAVSYRAQGDFVVLNRHGAGEPLPPHAINHRANIRALANLGFRDVIAFNSVGSLKPDLPPGTFVSCSDYVALQQGPATYFDAELKGTVPRIANNLVQKFAARLAQEFTIVSGRTYVQMRGPRFETRAEINLIRHWGDVVGMTLAHEADLCAELGLNLNSLAMVDNFANGIEGNSLDYQKFKEQVKANQEKVDCLFAGLLAILTES